METLLTSIYPSPAPSPSQPAKSQQVNVALQKGWNSKPPSMPEQQAEPGASELVLSLKIKVLEIR